MAPINIEVTNEDISKLAQDDERFRYLMQLNAAMRIIEELTARVEELENMELKNNEPPKIAEFLGA